MTFLSYNDQGYRQHLDRQRRGDEQAPPARPGLVMLPDGRAFLVEGGLRNVGTVGEGPDYSTGTEDWMWRDPKTGQEHYLSDYADKGAKLYDTSENSIEALREREGRGVLNRGGFKQGAWVASMAGAGPNQLAGATTYWDVAEQADDADSLGYLTRINPTVRKQIFDAAGVTMPAGLNKPSADDIAKLERTMYKIDPMSFGGYYGASDDGQWMTGQASMGGVDPMYGRRTANKGGEYFKNPENLKFDPNYGLYNDGSAGFVRRPKKSALQQGMPFIAAATALMGGAALGAFGAEASMAGAEASMAGAGAASEGLSISGITQPLNITGNKIVDSALTGMGRNAIISGATGRGITPQGLITSGLTGGISGALPDSLGTLGKFGVSTAASGLIGRAMGGGAGETTTGAVSGAVGNGSATNSASGGNAQQVSQNATGGFALGRLARETWGV